MYKEHHSFALGASTEDIVLEILDEKKEELEELRRKIGLLRKLSPEEGFVIRIEATCNT